MTNHIMNYKDIYCLLNKKYRHRFCITNLAAQCGSRGFILYILTFFINLESSCPQLEAVAPTYKSLF